MGGAWEWVRSYALCMPNPECTERQGLQAFSSCLPELWQFAVFMAFPLQTTVTHTIGLTLRAR